MQETLVRHLLSLLPAHPLPKATGWKDTSRQVKKIYIHLVPPSLYALAPSLAPTGLSRLGTAVSPTQEVQTACWFHVTALRSER